MSIKKELAKSELTAISTQINLAHKECLLAMRSSLDHAIKAGDLLIQAKAKINHGDWLKWLSNNCECSERTARAYMRVAKNKTAIAADMTMTEALKMLSAPKASHNASPEEGLQKLNKAILTEISVLLYNEKFKITPTGLTVVGDPSFEEWLEYGKRLKIVDDFFQSKSPAEYRHGN